MLIDIISTIQDRQYKFFEKITRLHVDEASVANVIRICDELEIIRYYKSLSNKNNDDNLLHRKESVRSDGSTMNKRYLELTKLKYCDTLYEHNIHEHLRIIITRWRLSSHNLNL